MFSWRLSARWLQMLSSGKRATRTVCQSQTLQELICLVRLFVSLGSVTNRQSPSSEDTVPRGEPKYPGNQASFSLQEPSSLPDAPCCLLFPLSSSPPILSASEHYKRSISSLWFPLKCSHSFFLQPAYLWEPHIDQFLIFFFFFRLYWTMMHCWIQLGCSWLIFTTDEDEWGRYSLEINTWAAPWSHTHHPTKTCTLAWLETQTAPSCECVGVKQQQSGLDDSISGPVWNQAACFSFLSFFLEELPLCIKSSIQCSDHHSISHCAGVELGFG